MVVISVLTGIAIWIAGRRRLRRIETVNCIFKVTLIERLWDRYSNLLWLQLRIIGPGNYISSDRITVVSVTRICVRLVEHHPIVLTFIKCSPGDRVFFHYPHYDHWKINFTSLWIARCRRFKRFRNCDESVWLICNNHWSTGWATTLES